MKELLYKIYLDKAELAAEDCRCNVILQIFILAKQVITLAVSIILILLLR